MPSSHRLGKKERRSRFNQTTVTKPPDLGGRIMWLPKLNQLSTSSGLPDMCHDHPVIVLSPRPLPNDEVVILMITSFGGKDLLRRHRHDYERPKRANYLPIDPSPVHPDDPDKNVVLKLGGGAVLRKNSWVNTATQHRVAISLLRNYDWWKTEKKFVLTPESYKVLTNFVRFRAPDDVVAGSSGTPEPEPGPAVAQRATPPLTPQIRPVVVPEPAPEPVTRSPDVLEPATANDSDSDTTIVAENYWEAEMRRLRDQTLSQRFTIIREDNDSNPSVFMGAHRASYTTSASEQNRQQPPRPVLQLQDNEQSSLLRPQTQSTAPSPRTKPQALIPATRTGYGTISSSSRPSQVRTDRAQELSCSQLRDLLTAAETARVQACARAAAELPKLERERPWHTWFSRLGLPFRFDFVFFGTSSTHAQARARAYAQNISVARDQAGLGPGPDTERVVEGRLMYTGLTRAQRRELEAEGNAGPAYEYARIAPSEGHGKGKGRLSMLAKGVLVFVILLIQATLLAAVLWSVVRFGVDKAVIEWVAKAAGKVVGAWEAFVYGFWVVVDFVVQLVIGLLYLAFIIACLGFCMGG
ncbi:hypothetical protein B0T09DRAFT_73716 [Sordaria sp. MPI-SDFR-AT-0083]|nr:hypothetical protein B0T09DRAFT_73716 [Sordaria sp. MPI-SDFR-AT-0083]